MKYLGLDIGGANLKAADGRGKAIQVPFPLWKHPENLADELRNLTANFDGFEGVAVTMTGELCDCFPSKADGVRHILASVAKIVDEKSIRVWVNSRLPSPPGTPGGEGLGVRGERPATTCSPTEQPDAVAWDTTPLTPTLSPGVPGEREPRSRGMGQFVNFRDAALNPSSAAASNWLALATFAGRFLPRGPGLLIDLGSTTCDVVPLVDGLPRPTGSNDPERLRSGELVYCGVRRTPLCAVFGLAKAAEWFATTEDVYVVLGELPERPESVDSADGRPMTKAHAAARLARMECDEEWSSERASAFARQARDLQIRRVAESVAKRSPVAGVVMAGAGEFLIPSILEAAGLGSVERISLGKTLGADLSTAACAHAVARLAEEER